MAFRDHPTTRVWIGIVLPILLLLWVAHMAWTGRVHIGGRHGGLDDLPSLLRAGVGLLVAAIALHCFAWNYLANYDHLAERAQRLRLLARVVGALGIVVFMWAPWTRTPQTAWDAR